MLSALALIAAWLALPLIVWGAVRNRRLAVVPAMALTMATALGIMALVALLAPTVMLSQQAAGRVWHDTHYIVSRAPAFLTLAAGYAILATVSSLIIRLCRPRQPLLPGVGFWLFHLGAPLAVFPVALLSAVQPMPHRYVDYPAAFAQWTRVAEAGVITVWLAILTLLAGLTLALIHIWRR